MELRDFPKRSTLSDANKRRSSEVFADIYAGLYKRYRQFLSGSRIREPAIKDLKIVDSSTIALFSDILRGVGRNPLNGKKKGGIKMHTMINVIEYVPCLIKFSSAATHDHIFLKELDLKKGSFVVFDKGYVDYEQYQQWSLDGIYFVTRQKSNARYSSLEEFDIPYSVDAAVLKDEKITLTDKDDDHEGQDIAQKTLGDRDCRLPYFRTP
ncbi:transposase [Gelidibacter sp.]|uniref:transposase n=1 Tax=Gelidibacter sp. TaxID=2018083 RepID=UPI003263D9FE